MKKCLYRQLHISIPSDSLSTYPSLREKTLVAGFIARAAAAARVERIAVYRSSSTEGFDVLVSVLRYLSEPAYLRRMLFPLRNELKYAGILPPLTIPSVNEGARDKETDSIIKIGVVTKCEKGSIARIYIGEKEEVRTSLRGCKEGITVMVALKEGAVRVMPRRYGIWRGTYWGYQVKVFNSLEELIHKYRKEKFALVGTSRYGEWPGKLAEFARPNSRVNVIFGSPSEGLLEKLDPSSLDALVNTFPCQGVKTLRLEEAIWSTLSLFVSLEYGL